MLVRLWDIDIEYSVSTDVSAEGKDIVRITNDNEADPDICLDKNQCLELARVLTFMANELTK